MTAEKLPDKNSVTVIGAGPAGALCAGLLARRGLQVLLVDKAKFPRDKVCGCCLSATAQRVLADVGLGALTADLGAVPLKSMELRTKASTLQLELDGTASVSRKALDAALVSYATTEGATFMDGVGATVSESHGYGISVELERDSGPCTVSSKVVVVADGLSGLSLRNHFNLAPYVVPGSRVGTGAISSSSAARYQPGIIYMCYGHGGYVGLVRLENGDLDIAAAFDMQFLRRHHNPASAVRSLLNSSRMPVPDDINDLDWRGTVPLTRSRKSIADERIFVIGDSASYVEPFTGEGIAWALQSAQLVAPLVERGTAIWHPSLISKWNALHAKQIQPRQSRTAMIAWLLKQEPLAEVSAAICAATPNIAQRVAMELRR